MKRFIIIYLVALFFLSESSYAQNLKKMGIQFNSTTYNFGDIQLWENQPAIFELTNNSKRNISILPLFSEIDLEVIYPEGIIKPNEKVVIKAIYYTSGTGGFTRKFPIYFDFSGEPVELKITGNIKNLSPTAYIQCPQAKPEHSKSKVELAGNVIHIESELPISDAEIEIISVGSKTNATLVSDKIGNFGTKLPVGNYQVLVKKEGFEPHSSYFYLGQNTGYLKIKLKPIEISTPLLTDATKPIEEKLQEKETKPLGDITTKEENIYSSKNEPIVEKVKDNIYESTLEEETPPDSYNSNKIETKEAEIEEDIDEAPIYNVKDNVYQSIAIPAEDTVIEVEKTTDIEETYAKNSTPEEDKKTSTIQEGKEYTITPEKINRKYTIRVIDQNTYEPIPQANVELNQINQRKPLQKEITSDLGLLAFSLPEDYYNLNIDAPNYISNDLVIKPNDDGKIIRVYLEPMSASFGDIYEAKKEEIEKEDLLGKLSYGDNTLSYEEDKVEEPVITSNESSEEEYNSAQQEPENLEPNEVEFVKIAPEETSPVEDNKQQVLDSIQLVLAQMEAEKAKMELELMKANLEISKRENELTKKELELLKKDAALDETSTQLEETKLSLAEQEQVLENTKDSLDLAVIEPKVTSPEKEESIELSRTEYAANNVLFLIDISSSMSKGNKMELLKESMKNLTSVLRDIDKVAIIAYNQKTNVLLEGVTGSDKLQIIQAIDSLETYGLTYGVRGLQTAYDLLNYHYIGDGNNQIILATDGLFSKVNATMTERELNREVSKKAKEMGIKLSVVGFGDDDEADKLMETLAENGEGQYIKIKNPWEARTVLIEEIKVNSKR